MWRYTYMLRHNYIILAKDEADSYRGVPYSAERGKIIGVTSKRRMKQEIRPSLNS